MNGMVENTRSPEFSPKGFTARCRLLSLCQISSSLALDEKNSDMPFEAVDIYELAEDIVYHLQPSAEKKQISLVLEGEHVAVRGIRQVLYEMFYNIADNAIRYTDAGGTVRVFAGQGRTSSMLFCGG